MKKIREQKRKIRTRKNILKGAKLPRLSVFRSNKYIYAQIVDDKKGKTVLGVSQKNLEKASSKKQKAEVAKEVGILIAKQALDKKIKKVVFDRGSYSYHGRVKSLADGAREGGLEF